LSKKWIQKIWKKFLTFKIIFIFIYF
jgi:hypothetical protein